MNGKNIQNPGEVFKTFSHKTKINPGNVNDDELMKDIAGITEKISFDRCDTEVEPFIQNTIDVNNLREDEIKGMNNLWLKAANETKDNYICVSTIMDGKEV